jgi:nitrite reductase/ring-hydroxylating ferredoxin subunit/uncharacterized membrane protein
MKNPIAAIEQAEILDSATESIAGGASKLLSQGPIKDALTGKWLGHPVHPMLTDLPIGFWVASLLFDFLGGKAGRSAADRLIGLGILSALPTAASGVADWVDTIEEEQRVGFVHALGNVTAIALYTLSYRARMRGHRREGVALSLLGAGSISVSGYLGGHLAYSLGAGVDRTAFDQGPQDWTPALPVAELPEKVPAVADADGITVLLYREGDEISAIADKCSHRGGPLHEGEIDPSGQTVTCPWHASEFNLKTGKVVHGPATAPQPLYEARISGDQVEVRRSGATT